MTLGAGNSLHSLSVRSLSPVLPSVPLRSRHPPLPSLPLEVAPHCGWGPLAAHKLPGGSGILVQFTHKSAPFRLLIDKLIYCVLHCPLNQSFRDIFVIHCPGQKDLEHTIWQPFGEVKFFFWGGVPPKKMPGINTAYSRIKIHLQVMILLNSFSSEEM